MKKKRLGFYINISEVEIKMIEDLKLKHSINMGNLLRLAIKSKWEELENKKK